MNLSNKVLVLPNLCGIHFDLTGEASPSVGPSLQPFYNTVVQNATPTPVYFTPSKGIISETGTDTRSGMVWEQKLQLQFPSNDPLKAMRLEAYLKVKYIYITLSTGMVLFFGRNDYFQNAVPKRAVVVTKDLTQITYTLKSISPMGFTNGSFDFQLPEDIPINFYNL